MKKIIKILLLIVMAFSVVGCSGGSDDNGNNSDTAKNDPIKIEELDWSVEEGLAYDNLRMVVFNYTNNSKYTIVDFQVKFTLKNDVTDEQLDVFDKVKKEASWTDEDIKEIYITGYNHKMAEPGETLNSSPVRYNGTYRDVLEIEQYNLMEPDVASIVYLSGDKLYMTHYDYKTQKYTEDSESGMAAYQWSTSDMAKYIPKPDVKVGVISYETEDGFEYGCFGIDKDFFNKYVEDIKSKGFTEDPDTNDYGNSGSYEAKNKEGYEVSVHYDATDEQLTIILEKSN